MEKQKIMVVEDEYIVAASLESCLKIIGYEVSGVVDSGEKAIEFSEKGPPDLILMDIKLNGEMDGVEAAEEIISRWHIPIIFLTAYSDEKLLERAKLVKPYGFLIKPFQDREIKATIEMALYKSGMENEIFKVKQEWEKTFNLATDLIAIIDKKYNFVRINQAFADRLNISPDEAIGKKCYELMHYRDSPPPTCPHIKVLEEGETIISELDDSLYGTIYMSTATPYQDKNGNVSGSIYILRDITELKNKDTEQKRIIGLLEDALAQVKELSGLLPICSNCKQIRTDKGYLERIEAFLQDHSGDNFPHGICPDCEVKLYKN